MLYVSSYDEINGTSNDTLSFNCAKDDEFRVEVSIDNDFVGEFNLSKEESIALAEQILNRYNL